MEELVSVIVPVYGVAQYLKRCVRSLLGQTYSNLEILLVDDGSKDECPGMCDEFAREDSRIKVIHQQNAGLSAARNTGLRLASGQYLAFVDSDDWVEPDYIERLALEINKEQADLSVCGHFVNWEKSGKTKTVSFPKQSFDTKGFLRFLSDGTGNEFVWNKLYRSALWKDITFPVGRYYEDIYVLYRIAARCPKAVTVPKPLYHYVQRSGSVSKSKADIRLLHGLWGRQEKLAYFQKEYPDLAVFAQRQVLHYALWVEYLIRGLGADPELAKEEESVLAAIRGCKRHNGFLLRVIRWTLLYFPTVFNWAAKRMVHLYEKERMA